MSKLHPLDQKIISCKKCPRLVKWREKVAKEKVKRFESEKYWGKAVPAFGDVKGQLLIVGLAPAAHGANRTGRMFTGDRSGDWLYRALYKSGFANQAESVNLNDGLKLKDCMIGAVCHCAPPENKPEKIEIENCRPFLTERIKIMKRAKVILCLGKLSHDQVWNYFKSELGLKVKRPDFGHGSEYQIKEDLTLMGSYHPSQQNTFTGKLTEPMFDRIFNRINKLLNRKPILKN